MAYGEAKVYFDGSHYIAIPYVPNPHRKKAKVKEKETASPSVENEEDKEEYQENFLEEEITGSNENEPKNEEKLGYITDNTVILDKKEIFEGLYKESFGLKRHKQKKYILERISDLFDSVEEAEFFVDLQLNRKYRNAICRRTRLMRKVNLQEFNYFCTFTYDSKKHTEESFKKGLKTCFRNFCYRQNWKYVGAWERSPEKQRLHFHGIFYIPESKMVGELQEVKDYDTVKKRTQITLQNMYFNERFGRSDFKVIENRTMLGEAVMYLLKYIEKMGEKLVYSKGLPQFFISDIMDEDVVCPIGMEDKKLLLFDDFNCFDEGELIGKVSKETIEKLRKVN